LQKQQCSLAQHPSHSKVLWGQHWQQQSLQEAPQHQQHQQQQQ
jgi:hypothetical protein